MRSTTSARFHWQDGAVLLKHKLEDQRLEATRLVTTQAQPGTMIAGRYKLLEAIGEGGMGTVWVAEQSQPVKRKVALKLIKAGMDSKSVLARFEAERQALAIIDHPNIRTPDIRPYFPGFMQFPKPNTFGKNERYFWNKSDAKSILSREAHAYVIERDAKP